MPIELEVNGKRVAIDADPTTPLLWVLRDNLRLLGTKYGCGVAQCGACTVHVDGQAVRSCVMPAAALVGKKITTIEGLQGEEASSQDGSANPGTNCNGPGKPSSNAATLPFAARRLATALPPSGPVPATTVACGSITTRFVPFCHRFFSS